MTDPRTARVMVRFAGPKTCPEQIIFSKPELSTVKASATAAGRPLSTHIREIAWSASLGRIDPKNLDIYQVVKSAAMDCGLPLAEFVRHVVLAYVGGSPLAFYLDRARALVKVERAS